MRLLAASLLTGLLCLSPSPMPVTFDSCSCNASDGTCSASDSCPGGCIAVCPGNGSCRVICSDPSDNNSGSFSYNMPISMQQADSSSKRVADELARITGKSVVLTPFGANDSINLDIKRAALWDVLAVLSESRKVEIGGDDFSKLQNIRKTMVTGERMSVCIHGASVKAVVNEFRSLSGLRIRIASGDPNTLVNLTAKDVTFDEFLAQLSSQTGVEITRN